ncbi:hypothetical protein [Thermaerobacillus caldiproteolyticus]|uniref:Uncharacterized protein n=1 Tax=Thermaerobacillus caldiproteolyticus TaxID=247480 RepID=A0A7V9Z8B0_9BACL|nr:hypothetical protein [Anoxybacillus caldiproteolyticus]MBA2875897.1 hypothetical protein [Anoxybacillus caldiproteolyticus]
MFDPTVFDNLKTVLEGAIYDLDLDGTIVITDRHDFVDLAHFSRTYHITFRLQESEETGVLCTVTLQTKLEQIAGELLQQNLTKPGCMLTITFYMPIQQIETTCPLIEDTLLGIWGANRLIRQTLRRDYKSKTEAYDNEITIEFGRLIHEENVTDLQAMVPYMLKSLQQLQPFYGM